MNAQTLLGLLLVSLSTANAWASDLDKISSRETGEDRYEITLASKTVFDVAGATKRLAPTALALCGDRTVNLGRYTFEKSEALTGENNGDWFTLVQDVHCTTLQPETTIEKRSAQLADELAVNEVRQKVRKLSQGYFEKRYANLGSDASSVFAAENISDNGKPPIKELTASGTPMAINLYRITVYDNPPDAPSKGIYVAVDYDNRIGNIPHHCGYLMWHSGDAVEFKLGRIETGTLDERMFAKIAPTNIPKTLKALRCSNFYDK